MTDFENVWITAVTAAKLKQARVDLGISQLDLANQIEASQSQIEKYEKGEVDMANGPAL